MKNHWLTVINVIGLLVFLDLICALQTSLWLQVLGSFPPPMMWTILVTYMILHRHVGSAVFLTYLFSFMLAAYTAEPFEHLLLVNMLSLVVILLIKNRIYWSGPNYFMLMTAGATVLDFVLFGTLSQFLDRNPLRSPEFFHWMISFLLTILASLPMYRFLRWWDRITQADETAESTGGLIL